MARGMLGFGSLGMKEWILILVFRVQGPYIIEPVIVVSMFLSIDSFPANQRPG